MFGDNRTEIRRAFTDAWRKRRNGETLSPLEQIIAGVVEQHPEYHPLLDDADTALDRDFTPEDGATNPFLHMGMHISLIEQIQTGRPPGITGLYRRITAAQGDAHTAEHAMMECLGRILWEAQRANRPPDDAAYLDCLKRLAHG